MSHLDIFLREDIYQTYHPLILKALNREVQNAVDINSITLDSERASFIFNEKNVEGKNVLDIGANQGYMSVEASLRGAQLIDAFESNEVDGAFLANAAESLGVLNDLTAHVDNYDFEKRNDRWNYVLCLNVLHHVGRYFDQHINTLDKAKWVISQHLQRLLTKGGCIWLQLGFNWQGNIEQPMFSQGTKREMTEFVARLIGAKARIVTIGIYSPVSRMYEKVGSDDWSHPLWQRIEELGEFGNRPLYLIEAID